MSTHAHQILIVEDQVMFRDLLVAKCQSLYSGSTVCGCGSGTDALKHCTTHLPDLALLDINLPDMDGLELGQQLLTLYPKLKVLSISGECSEVLLLRIKAARIAGFVDKNEPIEAIALAIGEVLAGRSYYSDSLRDYQEQIGRQANAWPKLLTDTEIKILPYLGANLPPEHIAAIFSISENTLLWHRKNIRNKLDLKSDLDLMRFCATKGFLLVGNGRVRPVKMSSLGSIPTRLPTPVSGAMKDRAI